MSNWTGNTVPNWYKDVGGARIDAKPNHSNDAGSLFQTDRGWEREIRYTDQHGNARAKRYVVVADRELQTDTAAVNITDVRIANATSYTTTEPTVAGSTAGDSFDIEMTFNQPVALSGVVTLALNGGTTDPLTAVYKSGNLTNKIVFTAPTNAEATTEELMISTTKTGAGTIVAWDTSTVAGSVHASGKSVVASANLALYGASVDTISASDNTGLANTVIE
jgi:hypothetical protein